MANEVASEIKDLVDDRVAKMLERNIGVNTYVGTEVSNDGEAAVDYADYHSESNRYSGVFGTCQWWVDTDNTLHIGAGELAATEFKGGNLGDPDVLNVPWPFYQSGSIQKVIVEGRAVANASSSGLFGLQIFVTEMDLKNLDTSRVVNMSAMFFYDFKLKKLDLSTFNTSQVTDMSEMFGAVGAVNDTILNLSRFDTSNVVTMFGMFVQCAKMTEIDVSAFDTQSVENMSCMFFIDNSLKKVNLRNFDVSSVTDVGGMFAGCVALEKLDLSNFDMKNVDTLEYVEEDVDGGYSFLEFTSALEQLTLNSTNKLILSDGINAKLDTHAKDSVYTGKWISLSTGTSYTADELMVLYDGDSTITETTTYVWQKWITTKDLTLVAGTGTTWGPSNNIVSAINSDGYELVADRDLTVTITNSDGEVVDDIDTTTTGGYTVTYTYVDGETTYANSATVTLVVAPNNGQQVATQYPDAELTSTLAADGQAISAELDLGTPHHN